MRGRAALAAGAALLLAGIVAVVALSGSESSIEPPPAGCLEAWNDDRLAVQDGVHAFTGHDYGPTEVLRFDEEGEPLPAGSENGDCGVVFGAAELDFEPGFSARIYADGRWAPLAIERRVPIKRLEELQQVALDNANATLLPDGTLVQRGS